MAKKKLDSKSLFYKINYSLLSLFVYLFAVSMVFLIVFQPDAGVRFDSFQPYLFLLLAIVLLLTILHLILRRKEEYTHKKRFLAVLMIILVIFSFLVVTLSMGGMGGWDIALGRVTGRLCRYDYKYYSGCEKEEGYRCIHYGTFGFGGCDACRKLICE